LARVLRSSLAELDLLEIWSYIADDNPDAADRFLDLVAEKCQLLAENPEMGRRREDLAPQLRSFPVGRYLIFYRSMEQGIAIARVLNAARDIPGQFERASDPASG
jgi:toxin ParE1/3/4